MVNVLTRKRYIRRGKFLRKIMTIFLKFQNIFSDNKSMRDEIIIDTEYGRVRTLWYGFKNTEKAPIYFDLHGGGFILGNADMDGKMNIKLNKHVGCKIISIDYAKAPEFPYPFAVNQVFAVVKHIFENADIYAIDNKKMAIGGHSAGGNISTVCCMKAKKETKFQFVCQILDYPPLDLATSALDKPKPKGAIPPKIAMIFDACYVDPIQAKDPYVSPVYARPENLEGLPPALFILAGRDSLRDEGLKYYGMLKKAGVVTECYEYSNALHGFTYKPSADTTDAFKKMIVFLRKYFQSDIQ